MIVGDGIVLGAGGEKASIFVTGVSQTDVVTATYQIPVKVPNPESKNLPDGYTELDYIKSSGTQYIKTGIVASNGYKATVDCSIVGFNSTWGTLLGSEISASPWECNWVRYSSTAWVLGVYSAFSTSATITSGTRYQVDFSTVKGSSYLNVNGSSLYTNSNSNARSANELYLLTNNKAGTPGDFASVKLYSCKITVDDILVRNFIPSKRNSDGAIGLYDLVSGTFFENSGTGTFTAGVEIPQYIEGYVDGKTIAGKWTTYETYTPVNIIPTMTSNSAPEGVASASNESLGPAFKAFDGTDGLSDSWQSSYGSSPPQWVQYKFPNSVQIISVALKNAADSTYSTTSQGYISVSDDGSNFTTVKTFSGLSAGTLHTLNLDEPVTAQYIRVTLTAYNNTYSNGNCRLTVVRAYGLVPEVVEGFKFEVDKYGTYKVTATDGTKTATSDVVVNSASEYFIEMEYKLYLYNLGDECTDVTGGWYFKKENGDATPYMTKADSYLDIRTPTSSDGHLKTNNIVSLLGYTKINFEYSYSSNTSNSAFISHIGEKEIMLKSEVKISSPASITFDQERVSNFAYVANFGSGYLRIHKIWLE